MSVSATDLYTEPELEYAGLLCVRNRHKHNGASCRHSRITARRDRLKYPQDWRIL